MNDGQKILGKSRLSPSQRWAVALIAVLGVAAMALNTVVFMRRAGYFCSQPASSLLHACAINPAKIITTPKTQVRDA